MVEFFAYFFLFEEYFFFFLDEISKKFIFFNWKNIFIKYCINKTNLCFQKKIKNKNGIHRSLLENKRN